MTIIKKIFLKRRGFWFYQFVGWIGLLAYDFIAFNKHFKTSADIFNWALALFLVFLITVSLRYVYKYILSHKVHLFFQALAFIGLSFAGMYTWKYLSALVFIIIPGNSVNSFSDYTEFISHAMVRTGIVLTIIFGWSIFYFGLKYWQKYNEEKKKAMESETLAREAQLKMLRYQINPHFLFNSLNSIQALIHKEPEKADHMLTELSEFLRYTFKYDDKTYIPFQVELDIIRKYLYIEKIRFPKWLKYDIDVSEEASDHPILCFLLQPLVENAIKHGSKSEKGILHIIIKSYIRDSWLNILVENTGSWKKENSNSGKGVRNVKARLNNAYPSKSVFNVSEENGWVKILMQINIKE